MGRESTNRPHGPLVCGVDDSDCGRGAARIAAGLAGRLGLQLVLVHVAEAPVLAGNRRAAAATTADHFDSKKAESVLTAAAVEEDLGLIKRRVEFGVPAERLVAVAEEEAAELLVVGTRGRGAFKAALLGSVSTKVIGLASCPVLIVPPGAAARA